MQYTSFQFLLFVAITALIYFLFPVKKYQWTILLIASYYFYLCAGYKFAVFLVATTVLTYLTALSLDKIAILGKRTLEVHKTDWDRTQKKEYKNTIKKKKQMVAAIAVLINLGILAFLKYYNFLAENLDGLFLRRPISVCDCEENKLSLIYKVVGKGTEQMQKMQRHVVWI